MHGVRLVSTPPANSAGSASAGLPLSIWAIEPSCTGMESGSRGLTGVTNAPSHPLKLQGHPGGVMSPITNAPRGRTVRRAVLLSLLALPVLAPVTHGVARAQATVASSNGSVAAEDPAALHLTMTPRRPATPGDSARAAAVAAELRRAILQYRDTTTAVADVYRMFAPQIKNQKVYHCTRGLNAIQEAFRFDPSKPTSL